VILVVGIGNDLKLQVMRDGRARTINVQVTDISWHRRNGPQESSEWLQFEASLPATGRRDGSICSILYIAGVSSPKSIRLD
jgi:hypothetical protein